MKEHRQTAERPDDNSVVFAHAADTNHTCRYEETEVIPVNTRKVGTEPTHHAAPGLQSYAAARTNEEASKPG